MDQAVEQSQDPQSLMEELLFREEGGTPENEEPQEQEDSSVETETEQTEESDEDTPESVYFTLKRGDEEVQVPQEEVIELAQKGYDYTKKTQAVAEERKTIEERAQALKAQEEFIVQQAQVQQALVKELAKVDAINDQIAQFEKVDWQAFSDSDPVAAQKAFFQYQQLNNHRQQALNELGMKQNQVHAFRQQRLQQQVAEGYKQLSKDIPDWSADKANSIREAAKNYGYSDQELEGIYDPRLVRLMHDAAQYRALQQAKPKADQKVVNKPPVVKPGGKDAKVAERSKVTDARNQLRKSGDKNLAAQLIERMI